MSQSKFAIDAMLGTIAKKMRILGFDCRYSSTIDDDALILVAKKENRVIITKDLKLANNAKKHDVAAIEVTTNTEKDQIVEIAKKMGWKRYEFYATNARCPICNGNQFSDSWKGRVFVFKPEESEIAKKMSISKKGYYAIKTK